MAQCYADDPLLIPPSPNMCHYGYFVFQNVQEPDNFFKKLLCNININCKQGLGSSRVRCRPHYRQLWPDLLDASGSYLYSHPENRAGRKIKTRGKRCDLEAHVALSKFSSVACIDNATLTVKPFFILEFQRPSPSPWFPGATKWCKLTDIFIFF